MKTNNLYSIYNSNSQLAYYMAGLIEGDGNIWVHKPANLNSRVYNPRIQIAFHTKETPLFEKLKNIFGGKIYRNKLTNESKYTISKISETIALINLINGKFRTPKINYLNRAIDLIKIVHSIDIKKLPIDNSKIESNAWLAGFSDADGHFQLGLEGTYNLNPRDLRGRVKCIFSIKQQITDYRLNVSCVPFFSEIARYFQCNVLYDSKNTMTFIVQSDKKHHITKSYFDKYSLLSSKQLNYISFLQGLNYLGKRLTDKEIKEVQEIKSVMNNSRKIYTWDHLVLLD